MAKKKSLDHTKVYETDRFVFFWKPPGWPGQWARSVFAVDDQKYVCAEQFMMAEKARLFGDNDTRMKILAADDPKDMRALGRLVSNFDPDVWDAHCQDIVTRGNIARFSQNPKERDLLLATGEKILVEASPMDRIWGIGLSVSNPKIECMANWRGKNLLGQCLMEARRVIREQMKRSQ